jgi:hypothetical protein
MPRSFTADASALAGDPPNPSGPVVQLAPGDASKRRAWLFEGRPAMGNEHSHCRHEIGASIMAL